MSYSQSQRRSINPRWILVIGIVLFALGRFACTAQINPVTGERQFVKLTPDQEVRLGLESAPVMAQQMGGVVQRNDPRSQLVIEVGERLVGMGEAGRSPYEFQFHLLRDPKTINAFALPGGQIFITVGLLTKMDHEAQLAGVLGHEIGHVIHRHGSEHMAKGELGQMLVTAVGVAASGDDYNSARNSQYVAQVVNQMAMLRYGRNDETESDSYGLKSMVSAGYDPSALVRVMEILAEASGGNRQPEFLSSHPHPEHRLEAIQAFLEKTYPNGIPKDLTQGRRLVDGMPQ